MASPAGYVGEVAIVDRWHVIYMFYMNSMDHWEKSLRGSFDSEEDARAAGDALLLSDWQAHSYRIEHARVRRNV